MEAVHSTNKSTLRQKGWNTRLPYSSQVIPLSEWLACSIRPKNGINIWGKWDRQTDWRTVVLRFVIDPAKQLRFQLQWSVEICKNKKSFPSYKGHTAAMISVSVALSQTLADVERPDTGLVHRVVCLFTSLLSPGPFTLARDRSTKVWTTCPESLRSRVPTGNRNFASPTPNQLRHQ